MSPVKSRETLIGLSKVPGTGAAFSGFNVPRPDAARSRAMPRTPTAGQEAVEAAEAVAAKCADRAYGMERCYPEAEAAAVPLDFNVPSFVATVLEGGRAAERHTAALSGPTYNVVALDLDWAADPAWFGGVLRCLAARADAGRVCALPLRSRARGGARTDR